MDCRTNLAAQTLEMCNESNLSMSLNEIEKNAMLFCSQLWTPLPINSYKSLVNYYETITTNNMVLTRCNCNWIALLLKVF